VRPPSQGKFPHRDAVQLADEQTRAARRPRRRSASGRRRTAAARNRRSGRKPGSCRLSTTLRPASAMRAAVVQHLKPVLGSSCWIGSSSRNTAVAAPARPRWRAGGVRRPTGSSRRAPEAPRGPLRPGSHAPGAVRSLSTARSRDAGGVDQAESSAVPGNGSSIAWVSSANRRRVCDAAMPTSAAGRAGLRRRRRGDPRQPRAAANSCRRRCGPSSATTRPAGNNAVEAAHTSSRRPARPVLGTPVTGGAASRLTGPSRFSRAVRGPISHRREVVFWNHRVARVGGHAAGHDSPNSADSAVTARDRRAHRARAAGRSRGRTCRWRERVQQLVRHHQLVGCPGRRCRRTGG